MWMRYIARTDVVAVKQFAIGLAVFAPAVPKNVGAWFYVHLALVSTLAAYLPFSKLMHMGGVFLSPTRNLANNSRMQRGTSTPGTTPSRSTPTKSGKTSSTTRSKRPACRWRSANGEPQTRTNSCRSTTRRRRADWMDTPVEFRKGTYCYSALAKNLNYLGLPNPREWQPFDADWKLPPNWKQIILDGMKERLEKYRSFRLFMDICVRCGACADKCHFYLGSGDRKNMPVLRAELMRSVYRRYFTAGRPPASAAWPAPATSPRTSSRSGSTTSTSAPSAAAARSSALTASTPPKSP